MLASLTWQGSQLGWQRATVRGSAYFVNSPRNTIPRSRRRWRRRARTCADMSGRSSRSTPRCRLIVRGFLRVRCDSCHAEDLVPLSCKKRGFCVSCGGARRVAESAALLVDEVSRKRRMRQGVLSVPYPLHFPFASRPEVMGRVLGIVYRCSDREGGVLTKTAQTGAVTLIQRFGTALNLNVHFHMLFLDGV